MRTRKGKNGYALPPFSMLHAVTLVDKQGINYPLMAVQPPQDEGPYPPFGRPHWFFTVDGELFFSPIPDAAYKIDVLYYPPIAKA